MRHNHDIDSGGGMLLNAFAGALAGAAAVWVMDRVDWTMYNNEEESTRERTKEVRPGGLDPAHTAVQRVAGMAGKSYEPAQPNKLGVAVHYNLGIGPGMLYSVLVDRYPSIGKGRGLLYGLGLFLVQDEAINSTIGLAGKPRKYPWQDHARGLIAHLVYGVTMDAGVRISKSLIRSAAQSHERPQEQDELPTIELTQQTAMPDSVTQRVDH